VIARCTRPTKWRAVRGTQVREPCPTAKHATSTRAGGPIRRPSLSIRALAPLPATALTLRPPACGEEGVQGCELPCGRWVNPVGTAGDKAGVVHISTGSRALRGRNGRAPPEPAGNERIGRGSRRNQRAGVGAPAPTATAALTTSTGMPLSTDVPESGSIASWSASTFEFTPARSAATRKRVPGWP